MRMVNCARCCLHNSVRALNLFANFCGITVIIYTLWLLKKWQDGVSELPPAPIVPKPWFIYSCLGVGIALCLITVCSSMVAHCITDYTLLIYIISIFSFLSLEAAVIVIIFYKMDWSGLLENYIDDSHEKFRDFMLFHLFMCRLIEILILLPQIKCTVLAIILWGIGTEPRTHCSYSDHIPHFRYSFLVTPHPTSLLDMSRNGCRHLEALPGSDHYEYPPRQSLLSRIQRFFRRLFYRRVTLR